ncbi:hypothetical protein Ddc_17114 [Ditylenchus destructor]|nr:hypothetical protein Ddc_17114 [Ditylenchus destructor]
MAIQVKVHKCAPESPLQHTFYRTSVPSEASTSSFGSISKSISTEIPVQVNFLDNGNEEMCSVKHVGIMNILSLFSDALNDLYYKGVCDHPSQYKLVNVRISDPSTPFSTECQIVNVEDNPATKFEFVHTSRIYSLEVRQIDGKACGFESFTFKVQLWILNNR